MKDIDSSIDAEKAEQAKEKLVMGIYGISIPSDDPIRKDLSLTSEHINTILSSGEGVFKKVLNNVGYYIVTMDPPQFTQFIADEIRGVMQKSQQEEQT